MSKVEHYLKLAAKISRLKPSDKTFFHGCVAVRKDGATITACNGSCSFPEPKAHAEIRAIKKAGKHAILYLARTSANGDWANSTPCDKCWKRIKSAKVKKVVYTTGPNEYMVVNLE